MLSYQTSLRRGIALLLPSLLAVVVAKTKEYGPRYVVDKPTSEKIPRMNYLFVFRSVIPCTSLKVLVA